MNHPSSAPPDSTSAPEDPFFVLRDSRMLLQRRLKEIVGQATSISSSTLDAFTEALGEAHDELAASNQRDGFEQSHGLTASRITLMCDDDLELEIRIGEIAKRLGDMSGNTLWKAQLRYMTLLRRPEMAQEDNPVGPAIICQGLWAICRSSGAGHDGNFALLDRIEEQLGLQLPEVYNELNELLASRKIEPAQTQITTSSIGSRSPPATQAGATASASATGNSMSALQNMLKQQQGGNEGGAIGFTPVYGQAPGGNIAANAATLVMLNQLAARLDQLELSGAVSALSGSTAAFAENAPPRPLRAKDLDLPLGKPEAIALDTLALIFEAIFDTWELPDTVKTAIGRLQIPLLKLAIFDPSLFAETDHPARRLINGMARAAVGLARNVSRDDPISTRLWQLAGTVCETLHGDPSVLTGPLAELDALIAGRDRAVLTAAQPYVALLREKEAREKGVLAAQSWLQAIEQEGAAPEILDFLNEYWLRVMEDASIEGDQNGNLWQESQATIVDLLWSVEPKQTPEDRKRLAGLVPSLLKRISAGLDRIGTPAEQRTAFLNTCFNLQTSALRGNPPVPVRRSSPAPSAAAAPMAGIVVDLLEAGGRQLKTLTVADPSPAAYRSPTASVQTGNWLQFSANDREPPLCGLVCWQNPQSGNTLLYNPDWGYAAALSPALLEQQQRSAKARVVSSQAIFDIAAERALKQLAGARPAKGV